MKKFTEEAFPYNLLSYLKGTEESCSVAADRIKGMEYAIDTLPEKGKLWIALRFREGLPADAAARVLGITLDQERKLDNDTIQKLRGTSRWNWILYGIEGNVKRIKEDIWTEAYEEGYRKGVEDGRKRKESVTDNDVTLSIPITALSVSVRVMRKLTMSGFDTVGSLLSADRDAIKIIPGMGKQGIKEVKLALHKHGIYNTAWET